MTGPNFDQLGHGRVSANCQRVPAELHPVHQHYDMLRWPTRSLSHTYGFLLKHWHEFLLPVIGQPTGKRPSLASHITSMM
jgi:hypothetical protein